MGNRYVQYIMLSLLIQACRTILPVGRRQKAMRRAGKKAQSFSPASAQVEGGCCGLSCSPYTEKPNEYIYQGSRGLLPTDPAADPAASAPVGLVANNLHGIARTIGQQEKQ
jgi:hypothetical protein